MERSAFKKSELNSDVIAEDNLMNLDTFLDLFGRITKSTGNSIATIFNGDAISYSELDEMSDRFAKGIINKGIEPGSIIALGLYNDIDLIPTLLAIWKANCVYLPIDPNYPVGRIEMMLKHACPKLLISKKELISKFSHFKIPSYFIDENENITNIEARKPELGDLAYLMYTSGSTGVPKGIIVDHFALKHSATAYNELHPEKHIALVSGSISFDPSLLTIVSTLAKGGTLCLYDNRDGIDMTHAQNIVDLIEKNSVSFILSTPSFYSKIVQQNAPLLSLKNVDLCGEDIPSSLIDLHARISPNATLFNAYGPTEYAMGVTAGVVYDSTEKKIFPVTIGKPFSCNKIYLLDSNLKRVNAKEKGEIYITGPGLARGYFNQEKLTDEKFLVLDHLEDRPIRLYRTGDMGYLLPNEEIVFIGRSDLQVKINGHRVEIEEIEKCICKHPQIEKAVVLVAHENKNQLIAFSSGKMKVLPNLLEDFLSDVLPPYMIPSRFIQVKEWPLTNNGKIDKKALQGVFI